MGRHVAKGDADRNLLFAVLALRTELVRREDLLSAMNAWALDRSKSLGEILVEKGMLRPDRCGWVEAMVDTQLEGGHDLISTLPMPAGLMHSLASQPGEGAAAGAAAGASSTPLLERSFDAGSVLVGSAEVPGDATMTLPRSTDKTVELHPPREPDSALVRPASPSEARRYRILRPHAHGGLGQVFLALDEELGREVALKEINEPHADDPHSRARFVLEAEITGGLEHPGVVPVYSLNWYENGRPYYAMRFIRGESFDQIIERYHADPNKYLDPTKAILDFRRMLRRFIDVCNAIAYAHSRGVLHRDIKPQNIMIGKYGETLVVDWGLAKSVSQPDITGYSSELKLLPPSATGSAQTMPGSAIGTPQFMSPEQAAGDADRIGPASDIYSLGATLYCLLTGHVAFENPDVNITLRLVQRGVFPTPRVHEPTLSPALEAICLKAMALRPEDRYPTPRALADDIEHWLADEPVSAYPEPWTAQFARWRRRHRAWTNAAAFALVVVALTASLIAFGIRRNARETERRNASLILDRALFRCQSGEPARGMLELAYGLEYLRGQDAHLEHCFRRNLDGWSRRLVPLRLLREHRGMVDVVAFSPKGDVFLTAGANSEQGRSGGQVCLWTAAGAQVWEIHEGLKEVRAAAFDTKGERFAIGQADGHVRIYQVASRKPVGSDLRYGAAVTTVAFSPDGRLFVAGGEGRQVHIWDAYEPGSNPGRTLEHPDEVHALAFSPDSTHIAVGCDNGLAYVWPLAGKGGGANTTRAHDGPVRAVAFHPSGQSLITGGLDGIARLWTVQEGQLTLTGRRPIAQAVGIYAAAFRPDGKIVALGTEDNNVQLWDPALGEPYALPIEHAGSVVSVAFSPDGNTLLTGCQDQYARAWDIPETMQAREIATHEGPITALAFDQEAKSVLSADGGKRGVVRLRSRFASPKDPDLGPARRHAHPVLALALSQDGLLAVSGCADGSVSSWDPTSEDHERTVGHHKAAVTSVRLRPDERAVLTGSRDGMAYLWDLGVSTPRVLASFSHAEGITAVDFAPDGKTVLTAGGEAVRIWSVANPEREPLLIHHPGPVYAARFRKDSTVILTAGESNTAQLWDARTGSPIGLPMIHEGSIRSVAFGPQGFSILTGSNDRTARLWDTREGRPVGPPLVHANRVSAVAFGPLNHDDVIATGSEKGVVRIWNVPYPFSQSPEHLKTWVEVATGMELRITSDDTTGIVQVLRPKELETKRERLKTLGGAPTRARTNALNEH